MTKEEAKSCISTIEMLQRLAYNIHGVMDVIDADNCEKIIKALEQEPNGDLISRQAVHEAITRWAGSMSVLIALPTREVRPLLDSIHELPSVKQEPKTGHWTKDECGNIICSECKRFRRDCRYGHTNYCNHCGARMFEPQESEG